MVATLRKGQGRASALPTLLLATDMVAGGWGRAGGALGGHLYFPLTLTLFFFTVRFRRESVGVLVLPSCMRMHDNSIAVV